LLGGGRPEVDRVAASPALETLEDVVRVVDGEAAAGARGRAVQRARPAALISATASRLAAQQPQHVCDRDGGAHRGEVQRGPRGLGSLLRRLLVLRLADLPTTLAGLGQLAVALLEDLRRATSNLSWGVT
jgi:hypothetical protein